MRDRVGQRLGNYRLMSMLGRGGFAEVYLGEHVFLRTQAAIKVLEVRLADEEMEGFLNEARTIAGLTHPNILRVLEFGVEDNVPFLVLEYARNGTLRRRHPKGSILPLTTILLYVKQVASALQYVHNKKLIHRDIKPENLLLGSNNEVLLSDFGTALVVQTLHNQNTLEMAGTVTYMAPEQIRGKPRPASDQYGLAVVVYEWLCGAPPFQGSFTELYSQHMLAPPPSLRARVPAIPYDVELVVMTALAKDPDQRFASVLAFANALEQANKLEEPSFSPTPTSASLSRGSSFHSPSPAEDGATVAAGTPGSEFMKDNISAPPLYEPPVAPAPASAAAQPVATPEPGPPPPKDRPPRRFSRRAFVVSVLGLASVAAAGGITWLVVTRQGSSLATNQTPTPVPGTTYVTYKGHTGAVYTVAWASQGLHIASGGADRKLKVWDANPPAGKDIFTLLQHSGSVNAVAWSPDGSRFASGSSDNTVRVWDAASGSNLNVYRGHTDNIRTIAWSRDGHIASGSDDKTVQVWDANTGTRLVTYRGHAGTIWSVSWSPDNTHIVSGSADKTVQVWNVATGSKAFSYNGHSRANAVKAVAWSPDGQHIASGGDIPESTVQIWDATTGNLLVTFSEHSGGIFSLAWAPRGQYFASSSWAEVRVWNPTQPTKKTLNTYTNHSGAVHSLAWSPDGQRIVSGADDTTVRIWQAI
jgi:WD40 repeat protein